MRKVLSEEKVSKRALDLMSGFHAHAVSEVEQAIQNNEWVIVGMAHNIPVINALKLMKAKDIKYKYIENGNYFAGWKVRLAIKLWSGWPTFPQVFHNGVLVGGFSDLKAHLKTT